MAEPTAPNPAHTNFEVAQRFAELADYLEILGENPFKTRAYRNAARALETLPEPIAKVAAEKRLGDIAGFGDAIQAKTKDILATGTTKALEEARSKAPATVLELIGLPGVGPKTVSTLFGEYGIDSLAALEKAIDEHKIRHLAGFGEKTEAKLKDSIERKKKYGKRMLLSDARDLGRTLIELISANPEVGQMAQAGSARRGVETVGDIDIVATSTDPHTTMKAFVGLPQVATVLASSDQITRVLLSSGVEADLKLVYPGDFGTLLHHFTGSREHNIRLREMAERKGLKISEYGVFRGDEKLPIGDSEDALYAAIGLSVIPVALRENRGEIEAALAGTLPNLIQLSDIKGDMHAHTTASDGKASIEQMALAAKARGYEYMAITDHSQMLVIANGLTPERVREQIKQVKETSDKVGIKIFTGTECDIKGDGTLDFPDDLLSELDFVIASIHSRFKMERDEMTARMIRAIENPNVDLIAHPTGRLLNQREPYEVDIDAVIAAAARTSTALEINSFPDRLDLSDVNARAAKDAGVMIMIDTDAHRPEHYDLIEYGVTVAQRAWIEAKNVWNTHSVGEVEAWLRR